METLFDEYTRAVVLEVERELSIVAAPLETVYFGGGTPTILEADQLRSILETIRAYLGVASNAEVTVEANPGTVSKSKYSQLLEAGFNRLSLGVQSLDDEFLTTLGRAHTAQQAVDAYNEARKAGFTNIGIDLIFALPGQTLQQWETTLYAALSLSPEHVSLYELSIEEGTRFAELCTSGAVSPVDEDLQIEMYELAIRELTTAGFEHYEVSNFARPGFRSRHNQTYWHNEPYYGFGAGATSYVGGVRARRVADPRAYVDAIRSGSNAIEFSEQLTRRANLAETIVLGLRMTGGIDLSRITGQTSTSVQEEFGREIADLLSRGMVELEGPHLRVTHKGLLLLNDVSQAFL